MNSFRILILRCICVLATTFFSLETQSQIWPATSWSLATNITNVLNPTGIEDLSGLHFNPANNRLYVVQDSGSLRILERNEANSTFSLIGGAQIGGGPEGITQANLYANEFYTIDESNYEIRRYSYATDFSAVTEVKHWNLLVAPSPMLDTGNTGPEGIVFVPNSILNSSGFVSEQTGQPYLSTKGLGGLFFVANQDQGLIWVYDVNPNTNNDFAFVGKYLTNRTESCELAIDRSSGLLYILHNIAGNNRLEVTDLSTIVVGDQLKFSTLKDYLVTNPSGSNDNLEGFALAPKCPDDGTTNAWLCRDVGTSESGAIKQDALRWFRDFVADGSCGGLPTIDFTTVTSIKIAPNPVHDELSFYGNFSNQASFSIFDAVGRLVTSGKTKHMGADTIDVTSLARGMYQFVLQDNGNATAVFSK